MSIEAMNQTFDFLHDLWEMKQTARSDRHKKVMWELDRAIGKAEKQRPVGWWNGRETAWFEHESDRPVDDCTIPLYTAPPLADIKDWEAVAADQAMTIAMMKAEKQEPVMWMDAHDFKRLYKEGMIDCDTKPHEEQDAIPLYTAPPQREWVELTDEEIVYEWELWRASIPRYVGFARAIEAKLREKNAYGWQSVENPTEYLDDLRGGDAT